MSKKDSNSSMSSEKSKLILLLLFIFLGGIGAHQFYAGNFIRGILIFFVVITGKLTFPLVVTFAGIVLLYELGDILRGNVRDSQGYYINNW